VLDHNLQDIVSLARLEATVARLVAGDWRTARTLDLRGFALELLRRGLTDTALDVVEFGLDRATSEDGHLIRRIASRLLLASGGIERAEEVWRTATRRASVDAAWAWIEIARLRERHRGDLSGALAAANAASRVLDLAFALGRGGGIAEIGRARLVVERRARRLRIWVAARDRRGAKAVSNAA
jgi:hypothetical protein